MAGFFFCRVGSHYWQRRGLRLWTIAFAAVPDVLKKGRLVDTQKNWKGRGYNGASIAAPIRIGNTDYIAVAVVLQDVNQNRFYLHEVALKEKLQGPAFKTEALTTKRGALNGADQPGVIKKLLINIFSVNPDEVSKAVDANGEPLATEALFEQLDAGAASGSNPDLLMQSNEIAQEQLQREYDAEVKRYKGTTQWLRAPNGKKSNLNERQWVLVRTPRFKAWFGDWESAATAGAIRDLVPVDASNAQEMSGKKDIENYFRSNSAVTNIRNGVTASFPITTAGKLYRHKGVPIGRIVGRLKEIFEHSIPFLSEKEVLKEGHKIHPNIDSFDHYVGKVSLDEGGEYYVRFTVRKEVAGKKGSVPRQEAHNVAVSDVQIYEKPAATNRSGNTPGEGSQPAFVDSKLRDFFAKVNPEDVSKVIDANGEPLVVYHATNEDFSEFSREMLGGSTSKNTAVKRAGNTGAFDGSNPNLLMQAADLPSSDFVKSLKEVDPKSANFKKWFQDSKIVDEEGNPLAVVSGLSRKSRVA